MTKVVCPGSFDPMHQGHVDVIKRAAQLFDEVIVLVATNTNKKYLFDEAERVRLVESYFSSEPSVSVEVLGDALLADFCAEHDASLLKGIRNGADFEYEVPMATTNRQLAGVETVFLASSPEVSHISSTIVKEVHHFGGDVSGMVNEEVVNALDKL